MMRAITLCLAFFGCLIGISAVNAAGKPLIGLTVNIPQGGDATDIYAAVMTARTSGVRLICASAKWSELEPKPGVYNFKSIDDSLNGLPTLGFRIAYTIKTLDTNTKAFPADLQDKPFDSPEVRHRFDALIDHLAPKLTDAVINVNLGNEADGYLSTHRDELEGYAGFVEEGRAHLHAIKPDIPVGVTTMFNGLKDNSGIIQRLNRVMDVVTMTYYPLTVDFYVRPVTDVPADFDAMVAAAGSKPLLLQEVGYPADPSLGSSEEKQAAFVDAVFDALEKHKDKIGFINFFLMYDFDDKLLDTLTAYYGLPDPRFRAYLATLGLRKADGTPRQAWLRFEMRAVAWANSKP